MTTYAHNAETFGGSVYAGEFDNVHAVCEIDGKTIAITDTSIFEITGDDDDGTDIAAFVKTGQLVFGNEAKYKYVPRAYAYMRNDDKVTLTTTTRTHKEEKDRDYVCRKTDRTYPIEQLVKLAQGVESVSWGFKLANVGGGTFEIKNLRVLPRISRPVR